MMMIDEYITEPQHVYLNKNANKIRWLSDTKLSQTELFCIGFGENQVKNKQNKTKNTILFV
jgi:hypothetical protein